MKKILFIVSSHGWLGDTGKHTGFYLSEVTRPWSVLSPHYEIDVLSPKGGQPPVEGIDLNDPVNKKYWNDPAWLAKMTNTLRPDQANPADYAAIFYAGGHGVMWDFPLNVKLAEICASIWENGGVVAAVCHGPAGLLNVRLSNGENLVRGKKLDCFTNAEETANGTSKVVPFLLQSALEEKGCHFDCGGLWSDHVVVDGRLITGQNPMSALSLGKKVLEALKAGNL